MAGESVEVENCEVKVMEENCWWTVLDLLLIVLNRFLFMMWSMVVFDSIAVILLVELASSPPGRGARLRDGGGASCGEPAGL